MLLKMVKFYLQELQTLAKKNRESYLCQLKELEIWLYYNMKVILLENLKKIGSIGEIIDVKRGFARNFLISNKKALYASKENIAEVEKIKSDLSKKDNQKQQDAKLTAEKIKSDLSKKDNEKKLEAKKISEQINNKKYTVKKLSTENKELYGSVKPTEIAKLIKESDKVDIKPSMIQPVQEIKSLGEFIVKVSLHSAVDAKITIDVLSAETIQ